MYPTWAIYTFLRRSPWICNRNNRYSATLRRRHVLSSSPFISHYKLFSYQRLHLYFISAGQIFIKRIYFTRKQSTEEKKNNNNNLFCCFDYKVTKAAREKFNTSADNTAVRLLRTNVVLLFLIKERKKNTDSPFFNVNTTALVNLCNTVNRIRVGLFVFHTQTVCESNQPAWIWKKERFALPKYCFKKKIYFV